MERPIDAISKEMDRLSSILEDAKNNEAVLKGRLEEAMNRLKKEFQFDSLEEAQAMLSQLEEEAENMAIDIRQKFQALQEKYEW